MARPGQPSPRFSQLQTIQTILGSLLLEGWDASVGVANTAGVISSWTGFILGTSVPSVGAPMYAADGSVFGGKQVVQASAATTSYLQNNSVPALTVNATRPWIHTIFRHRVLGPLGDTVAAFGNASNTQLSLDAANATQLRGLGAGSSATGPATRDTVRHSGQVYLDGTNVNLVIDNSVIAQTATAATNVSYTSVAFGAFTNVAGARVSTASIAWVLLCSAAPSAGQIAAIEQVGLIRYPG